MPVMGFQENATAQPVKWVEISSGDFGQPGTGEWQNDGAPVDVVLLPMRGDEKTQAGIEVDTEARKLYANGNPITTRQTLDIGGTRYNVRSVEPYDVPDFDAVSIATVVKL